MSHAHDVVALIKSNHSRKMHFYAIINARHDLQFDDSRMSRGLHYLTTDKAFVRKEAEAFRKNTDLSLLLNSKNENKDIPQQV